MMRRVALGLLLAAAATAAPAQSLRWTTASGSDGQKFGTGAGNSFVGFYVVCFQGAVSVNIETDAPENARLAAVIMVGGRAFRYPGIVEIGPEDNWLTARVTDPQALFTAMSGGRPITVQAGSRRVTLPTTGQTAAIQRGISRCR
jgi:hypothetical protein